MVDHSPKFLANEGEVTTTRFRLLVYEFPAPRTADFRNQENVYFVQ